MAIIIFLIYAQYACTSGETCYKKAPESTVTIKISADYRFAGSSIPVFYLRSGCGENNNSITDVIFILPVHAGMVIYGTRIIYPKKQRGSRTVNESK